MKIEFSKTTEFVPTWRGNDKLKKEEQIRTELKVLNMGALLNLVDAFSQMGITGEVNPEDVDESKLKPLLTQFGELLPQYVLKFEGLYDTAGQAITIEELVEYPVFLNLALEILLKLAEISSPTDSDVKNSKGR